MSGPLTIQDDGTAEKLSAEALVYRFDYDDRLATDAELASVGTFTINPNDGRLTKDAESVITGSRGVDVRLAGGKVGKTYWVEHVTTTTESPAQTVKARFQLHITPEL